MFHRIRLPLPALVLPAFFFMGSASTLYANTLAQQFQSMQQMLTPRGMGQLSPALRAIINSLGDNGERRWDVGQPNPPPGTPPHAVHVFIQRTYSNTQYRLLCGIECSTISISISVSIYFDDGSFYFYQYLESDTVCTNGDRNTVESTLDTASAKAPLSFVIRSRLYANGISATRSGVRAPPGFGFDLSPAMAAAISGHDNIELRAGPGGTLDLTGHSGAAPILVANISATLHADAILTDPGVSINDLIQPPPTVLPGSIVYETSIQPAHTLCRRGTSLPSVAATILNLSNDFVPVMAFYADTLNWVTPGMQTVFLAPNETGEIEIPVFVPGNATPCDESDLQVVVLAGSGGQSSVEFPLTRTDIDFDGDGLYSPCEACPNRRPGDVSGDGVTNASDLPGFAGLLLGAPTANPDDHCAADVNGDHNADGDDIMPFVRLIMS